MVSVENLSPLQNVSKTFEELKSYFQRRRDMNMHNKHYTKESLQRYE